MAITTFGRRSFEVAQGKLEAAVFGVIIVADGESDVDAIPCQKLILLRSFRHVPAQRIESNPRSKISSQFSVLSCQ
jgi:hypothetical protein